MGWFNRNASQLLKSLLPVLIVVVKKTFRYSNVFFYNRTFFYAAIPKFGTLL